MCMDEDSLVAAGRGWKPWVPDGRRGSSDPPRLVSITGPGRSKLRQRAAQDLLHTFSVPGAQSIEELEQTQAPSCSKAIYGVVVQHRELGLVHVLGIQLVVDPVSPGHHARPRELEQRAV